MRRLPIFIVTDVSESMAGDNIRQLQSGIEQLVRTLRSDPYALETAYLSIIAFAGRAKTLTPLVELLSFYPPRLPLGSGTSIGAVFEHLMGEIDKQVQRSSAEKKGDFRPLVFLMTDGKSTDNTSAALTRWKRDYSHRVNLVIIGIGAHANLQELSEISPNVLRLENSGEKEFKKFIDWISASVSSQSRSIGMGEASKVNLAKYDDNILKKIENIVQAMAVDEDFVIITGKCQNKLLPYLMKYERFTSHINNPEVHLEVNNYNLSGVFALERDFEELSDHRVNETKISTELLLGVPGCPHCGANCAFAACSCGQVFCINNNATHAKCPGCNHTIEMGFCDSGFEVSRSRG